LTLRLSILIMLITTESGVQAYASLSALPILHLRRAFPKLQRRGREASSCCSWSGCEYDTVGIYTSNGKLDPYCVIDLDGPAQKFTIDTYPMLSVRGAESYAVGTKGQSGVPAVYIEEAKWGTDEY